VVRAAAGKSLAWLTGASAEPFLYWNWDSGVLQHPGKVTREQQLPVPLPAGPTPVRIRQSLRDWDVAGQR